jgi:cytochrome P450
MTKPPRVAYDPFSPAAIDDPLPGYKLIRDAGAVVVLDNGLWAAGRHADVRALLHDSESFTAVGRVLGADPEVFEGTPLRKLAEVLNLTPAGSDPPLHTKLRSLVQRPLTPVRLKEFRPRLEQVAADLVDELCARGSFDAAPDLAERFPLTVVAPMVGLPAEDQAKLLPWAKAQFELVDPSRTVRAMAAVEEALTYLTDPDLPNKMTEGSWGAELRDAVHAAELGPEYFASLMTAYAFPSMDTTINAIANMVAMFADHPDQWQLLRENPDLVSRAVNEVLRLIKGGFTRKRTTRDISVDGLDIPKGTFLYMMLPAANRDERRYVDPDRFDITRDNGDQLIFGWGRHACAGMNLARLEMFVLLEALVKRVKTWELVNSSLIPGSFLINGYSSLEVKVG